MSAPMITQSVSHYVPAFTQPQPRGLQTAVCGKHVFANEHSSEPSCPQCAAWIDADEKEADALRIQWDDEAFAARSAIGGGK